MTPPLLLAREGFEAPGINNFHFPDWYTVSVAGVTFHFGKPMFLLILGTALVMMFLLMAFSQPQLVPRGVQNVGESIYDFVQGQIARPVMGKEGDRFVPYLTTLFCFVFLLNFWEIVPVAQFPVTSHIAYPALLAALTWAIYNYIGISRQGFLGYFKGVMVPPGVPGPLLVLLAPVELLSTIIVRPFTLAVRLFANMFAGHLLLIIFFAGTVYLAQPSYTLVWAAASGVMSLVMTGFEFFIEALQAYIFTILTASYISGALSPEH